MREAADFAVRARGILEIEVGVGIGLGGARLERGLIDFMISTGANLYHDLHYALNFTLRRGSPFLDDRDLYVSCWGTGELRQLSDTLGNNRYVALYRFLTPVVRTRLDLFSTYVWNPGKNKLRVLSYKVRAYCRKDR